MLISCYTTVVVKCVVICWLASGLSANRIICYQDIAGNRSINSLVKVFFEMTTDGPTAELTVYDSINQQDKDKILYAYYQNWSDPAQDDFASTASKVENLVIRNESYANLTRKVILIINPLEESHNGLNLNAVFSPLLADPIYAGIIVNVTACPTSEEIQTKNQTSTIVITSISNGYYGESANCSCCMNDQLLVYMNGTKADKTATCGLHAEWQGCGMLQCWSSPKQIIVSQINCTVNDPKPFNCSYITGFPDDIREEFRIDNLSIDHGYRLKSYDNDKSLSCNVSSRYTTVYPGNYSSQPVIITVYYPPENSSLSNNEPVIAENQSMVLNFTFFVNPRDNNVHMTVQRSGKDYPSLYSWGQNFSDGVKRIHELNIIVATSQDYGPYSVCASTNRPNGSDCANLTIRNTTMTIPYEPDTATYSVTTEAEVPMNQGISTLAIVLVIVGAAILLTLIVFIIFLCKKRRSEDKGGQKEEKLNELYGSALGQVTDVQNPGNAKQEKDNVLYMSAPGVTGETAGEYAMANPGARQNDTVGLSGPTSDDACSSNIPIYAQVDKKKGNINDGYNVEIHDGESGTTAITYAAIDRSKKRDKHDAAAELYTVVNKPNTTD